MHIVFDISVLRIAQAGVLSYTRSLLDALIRVGAEHRFTLLDVLPLNPGLPLEPLAAFGAPNVRLARLPGLRRGYISQLPGLRDGRLHAMADPLDRALDGAWGAASVGAMALALRRALRGADVFHGSDQLSSLRGAPNVLTIQDLSTLLHPEWHVADNAAMHAAKERAARSAAQIIVPSHAVRHEVIAHLGIAPERVTAIAYAADTRFRPYSAVEIAPIVARYGLVPQGYLLCVNTIEPRKNHIGLLEAYARLCASRPDTPPLVLAGGVGWKAEPILTAPAQLGIANRVRFLGKVPDADLPALLAGAALFVYPSLYEGFGLPLLEALASGVPAVASGVSSMPEVMGDAGVAVDPLSPASIADGMRRILDNTALAADLRTRGVQRAATFSWERAAREVLGVYARA